MTTPNLDNVVVCTDTAAIRSIGLAHWLDHRGWPVSELEFHALVDRAWADFDLALSTCSGLDEDAFLADTAMVSLAIQYVHDALACERSRQKGWQYLRGDRRDAPLPPNPKDAARPLARQIEQGSSLKSLARRLAKRWSFNGAMSTSKRVRTVLSGSDCWLVGSRSPLKLAWAVEQGYAIDAPDLRALIGQNLAPADISLKVDRAIEYVVNGLKRHVSEQFGIEIELAGLSASWKERHRVLKAGAEQLMRRRLPSVLILGEMAKPWSKVVAGACRRKGGHVVGDAHGFQIGHLKQRAQAWGECAHVSEYLCYNKFHRDAMAAFYAETPIAMRREVRFTTVDGFNAFASVQKKLDVTAHPAAGSRTIMVIGHPMNPTRYQYSSGDFFAVQLALECEIADVLRSRGFRVVYKAHPDRLAEIEGLLDSHFDHIETGYLDQVWYKADGFVFGGLTTTALNYALLTDRPVALINFACMRWNVGVRELLSNRAVLVPAEIDDLLNAKFDADRLASAFTSVVPVAENDYFRECLELDAG